MSEVGLEPTRLSALAPKASAATNYATLTKYNFSIITLL